MLDLSLDKRSKWQTLKACQWMSRRKQGKEKAQRSSMLTSVKTQRFTHFFSSGWLWWVRPQPGTLFSHPYWMNHSRWEFWFCDWKYFGVALSKRDSDHIPSSSMWWLSWCGNLARLQPPVIQSNVSLHVAMKGFCRCNESPSSLTLGKEDHSGSSGWAWRH